MSWWRNDSKGDLTLAETGWTLEAAGHPGEWDGLLGGFLARVRARPELGVDAMVARYLRAASGVN